MVQFSKDSATLNSYSEDSCLLRWALATTMPTRLFSLANGASRVFALSPDGNTVAVCGWPDSYVQLWDVPTANPALHWANRERSSIAPSLFLPMVGWLLRRSMSNGLSSGLCRTVKKYSKSKVSSAKWGVCGFRRIARRWPAVWRGAAIRVRNRPYDFGTCARVKIEFPSTSMPPVNISLCFRRTERY